MRRLAAIMGAVALAAGCSGSGTALPAASAPVPSASVAPGSSATPGPSAAPATSAPVAPSAPAQTPAVLQIKARVTFDGKTCRYAGPTEIPFADHVTIDFATTPAEQAATVGMMAIHPETTLADLNSPANPDAGLPTVPWFVYKDTWGFWQGPGTYEYPMVIMVHDGKPYDTYLVLCLHTMPGRPSGGFTILHLVDPGSASPAPTAKP